MNAKVGGKVRRVHPVGRRQAKKCSRNYLILNYNAKGPTQSKQVQAEFFPARQGRPPPRHLKLRGLTGFFVPFGLFRA